MAKRLLNVITSFHRQGVADVKIPSWQHVARSARRKAHFVLGHAVAAVEREKLLPPIASTRVVVREKELSLFVKQARLRAQS